MADNVIADPGAGGATFATDDITGVQWPFTKQAWGPRDTANEVDDTDGKRLPIKAASAATGAVTQVAQNVASVTLLASNGNRKGGLIHNATTEILYVRLEAAAVTTALFSEVLHPSQTMNIPAVYTGEIRGIWAGAGAGNANITELS